MATPIAAAPIKAAEAPAADPKIVGKAASEQKPGIPAEAINAAKPAEETETYVVNGKEVKLTKAQAKAYVQKGLFADQRGKSFDVLKSKTEALIEGLKNDPLSVLLDPALGITKEALLDRILASDASDEMKEKASKWVYENVVVQAKKPPEQIENEKKLAELDRLQKAEAARKDKELSEQNQKKVNEIYQAVRAEVTKQIVADKTFPQTEGSVKAVIEKLRVMNKKGVPITVESVTKALDFVKKDYIIHQQALLDSVEDPEGLIALLGEDRALKISKALVARIQAKAKSKIVEEKPPEEKRQKVTDRIDAKLGRTQHGYHILNV